MEVPPRSKDSAEHGSERVRQQSNAISDSCKSMCLYACLLVFHSQPQRNNYGFQTRPRVSWDK